MHNGVRGNAQSGGSRAAPALTMPRGNTHSCAFGMGESTEDTT